jgi:hypothetical protein
MWKGSGKPCGRKTEDETIIFKSKKHEYFFVYCIKLFLLITIRTLPCFHREGFLFFNYTKIKTNKNDFL